MISQGSCGVLRKVNRKIIWPYLERIASEFPGNLSHQVAAFLSNTLKRSVKQNLPRGHVSNSRPFWNGNLTKQKEIRDRARDAAIKTEGKILEK